MTKTEPRSKVQPFTVLVKPLTPVKLKLNAMSRDRNYCTWTTFTLNPQIWSHYGLIYVHAKNLGCMYGFNSNWLIRKMKCSHSVKLNNLGQILKVLKTAPVSEKKQALDCKCGPFAIKPPYKAAAAQHNFRSREHSRYKYRGGVCSLQRASMAPWMSECNLICRVIWCEVRERPLLVRSVPQSSTGNGFCKSFLFIKWQSKVKFQQLNQVGSKEKRFLVQFNSSNLHS